MGTSTRALVHLARAVREAGVGVGSGQVVAFCRAVAWLAPAGIDDIYWAGRATLVSRHDDVPVYDRAFLAHVTVATAGSGAGGESRPGPGHPAAAGLSQGEADEVEPGEEVATVGVRASTVDVLRQKSLSQLTAAERATVGRLVAEARIAAPARGSRRRHARPRGRHPDMRRTLRSALRTDGELVRRRWRRRRRRPRPLLLLLDVSGSMSGYSRALLAFAHALCRGAGRVEVFCFGTRVTRVTHALRTRDADAAVASAARTVVDWDGGTRIGASLLDFLRRWGGTGIPRGAVVVICCDGLERSDPADLASGMRRLARLSHRIVWVNPLKGDPGYQPLARGMAAALPHVDDFLPGHDLSSLEALGDVLHEVR